MKNNFLVTFCLAIILDQLLKYVIRSFFTVGSSLSLKIISITYVTNTGMSFGLLKGMNIVFILVSILVLGFFALVYYKKKKYPIQFGLICAGIIGNLIDRITFGYVIDFIDFRFFPVFNIADASIFIGIFWLVFILWKKDEDLI